MASVSTKVGIAIAAAGVIATVAGYLWSEIAPTHGGNIASGMLYVFGIVIAIAGVITAVVGLFVHD